MARWRHHRARDERLAVMVVLATGVLDRDNGVRAEVMYDEGLLLTFAWPHVVLNVSKIKHAVLSFSNDLNDGQGALLAQELRD